MKTDYVSIGSLFEIERGQTRFIRDYGLQHPGAFPVFSASLVGPMIHIDTYDFQGPVLVFTNNGYAGRVRILDGLFSLTRDCCALVPKADVQIPDLHYLRYAVEGVTRPLAVGRRVDGRRNEYTKLTREMVAAAEIPLLFTESGQLDLDAMADAGKRLLRIERLRANLGARLAGVLDSTVVLNCEPYGVVELGDESLFKLSIGKRVLRTETLPTGVPIYSANVRQPFGYGAESAADPFSRDSLIWGIDGNFDWNLIPNGTPFIPTDHCGRCEILDPRLDPVYLLHELRATREEYGFDRVFRASLGNIGEVRVRVPVDSKGNFDIARQRDLAERYVKVENLRNAVVRSVDEVVSAHVFV